MKTYKLKLKSVVEAAQFANTYDSEALDQCAKAMGLIPLQRGVRVNGEWAQFPTWTIPDHLFEVVRLGDWVLYEDGKPFKAMSRDEFKAAYEEIP